MSGPCMYCGATNYASSFGGPMICPSCDCGNFGPEVVTRQGQTIVALQTSIAAEWRPIAEAADSSVQVLGYQETPGDFEKQQQVCWAVVMSTGLFWIGHAGFVPTHWRQLPAPPVKS